MMKTFNFGILVVVCLFASERVAFAQVFDAEELAKSVETDRYVADLTFIANERFPDSPHWKAVQDLSAKRLQELEHRTTAPVRTSLGSFPEPTRPLDK